MLFHTIEFWLFFAFVVTIFYALPFRFAKIFLILASCFFYMVWNPRFIILLMIPTLIDFYTAYAMPGASAKSKKALLLISVVTNLGVLAFFKYYNFFISSVATALGLDSQHYVLSIVLPVGISFYTFNTLSYTIDVYRGILQPTRSIIDFSLFIVFFPHLVAGPIVRAADFLPQIANWKRPSAYQLQSGIDLIAIGLIKKMVFADQFALVSENYFGNIQKYPGALAAWSGTLAFTMQIFFDFSGYTDIARGLARVMGFEFHLNFARPYLSLNITEFWRRWHISLSSWLRDYLYIPLGGNRGGTFLTYRNLMITMLLGGLWHGASWNFVIWGGIHGALLSMHRVFTRLIQGSWVQAALSQRYFSPFKILLNLFFVMIAWVFFRATTLQDSIRVVRNLFSFGGKDQVWLLNSGLVFLIGVSAVIAVLEEKKAVFEKLASNYGFLRIIAYASGLMVLELFSNLDQQIPFVYFQF